MKRIAIVCAVAVAGLAAGAGPAGATNECRGLQVCVRVAGPWVVVPVGLATPRTPAQYQLTCPRGFIVAGLDAELSDRAIDIDFLGLLGSPVNPGTTTTRSAVFRGVFTGGRTSAAFRRREVARARFRSVCPRRSHPASRRFVVFAPCKSVPASPASLRLAGQASA